MSPTCTFVPPVPRGISLANVYLSNTNAPNASVSYFDGVTNTLNATIPIPAANALGMAFSPDARRLYVATADSVGPNAIVVLDTVPGSSTYQQVVANITLNQTEGFDTFTHADFVFVNPRGDFAYFLQRDGQNSSGIGLIDLRPDSPTLNQLVASVEGFSGVPIYQAAFTPNGKEMWWPETSAEGSKVAIINTNMTDPAFRQVTELNLGTMVNVEGIAINGNGTRAFISDSISNGLLVFDVASRKQVASITGGNGTAPFGPVVATNTGRVYVPTANQTIVRVYDGVANTFINEIDLGVNDVEDRFIALSPSQNEAYLSGDISQTLRVLDVTKSPPAFVANLSTAVGPQGNAPFVSPLTGGTAPNTVARPVILAVQSGPQAVVATLGTEVMSLVQRNILNPSEGNVLLQNLSQVSMGLAQGNAQGALNALDTFNGDIAFLTQTGAINPAVGTQIDQAVVYLLSQL